MKKSFAKVLYFTVKKGFNFETFKKLMIIYKLILDVILPQFLRNT